jgi:hypothetical protein
MPILGKPKRKDDDQLAIILKNTKKDLIKMHALFVHGMGRLPLSGWLLLRQLKRAGLTASTFGYAVSLENFAEIQQRLGVKVMAIAARGDYVLIGHSLGGVLLRATINSLPPETRRPHRLFLLGSPLRPSLIAQWLGTNPIYRILTRDCGQLLGSVARMSAIGPVSVPTTGIAGIRGLSWKYGLFNGEMNDGIVSLSEVSADWIGDQVQVPVVHTFLPSSRHVGKIILERLMRDTA